MTRSTTLAILTLAACNFVEEGMSDESSSSGFTDADETFDPSVGTTQAATATASATSSASTSSATTDESSSSDSGDPTFGDDATTTHGESSTGEAVESFALAFDGGLALSDLTDRVTFDATPYTIEFWVRRTGEFEGVFFDTTVDAPNGSNGLTFVRDPMVSGFDEVVVYDFGEAPPLAMVAFDLNALSDDWHHVAMTSTGTAIKIWVDGEEIYYLILPQPSNNPAARVAIGTQGATPFVPLVGVEIDELRISSSAIYTEAFVPAQPLEGDEAAVLHWTFDEGSGNAATDQIDALTMVLAGEVQWSVVE